MDNYNKMNTAFLIKEMENNVLCMHLRFENKRNAYNNTGWDKGQIVSATA